MTLVVRLRCGRLRRGGIINGAPQLAACGSAGGEANYTGAELLLHGGITAPFGPEWMACTRTCSWAAHQARLACTRQEMSRSSSQMAQGKHIARWTLMGVFDVDDEE